MGMGVADVEGFRVEGLGRSVWRPYSILSLLLL